jgi:biotin transport system substrate-specific component
VLAGICATIITLISGGLWIAGMSHAGLETATTIGIVPFLPGEVIKIIAAAAAFVALRRYARS